MQSTLRVNYNKYSKLITSKKCLSIVITGMKKLIHNTVRWNPYYMQLFIAWVLCYQTFSFFHSPHFKKGLLRKIFVTVIYELFTRLEHNFDPLSSYLACYSFMNTAGRIPFLFNFTNEHVLGTQILPFLGVKDNKSQQTVETTRTTTSQTHFLFHNFAGWKLQESILHS